MREMDTIELGFMVLEEHHDRQSKHIENVIERLKREGYKWWDYNERDIIQAVKACNEYLGAMYENLYQNLEMEVTD